MIVLKKKLSWVDKIMFINNPTRLTCMIGEPLWLWGQYREVGMLICWFRVASWPKSFRWTIEAWNHYWPWWYIVLCFQMHTLPTGFILMLTNVYSGCEINQRKWNLGSDKYYGTKLRYVYSKACRGCIYIVCCILKEL
jgi:hypothetical protein